MILKNCVQVSEKTVEQILVGDILKRKSDGFFYEIKDRFICDKKDNIATAFFGFVIVKDNNLSKHFYFKDNKFEIYKGI